MHLKKKEETFNFEVLLNWIEPSFFLLSSQKLLWFVSEQKHKQRIRDPSHLTKALLPSLIPFAHCGSRQQRVQFNIFVFDQAHQHFLEMNELTGNAALWVMAHFAEALLSLFLVHRWI